MLSLGSMPDRDYALETQVMNQGLAACASRGDLSTASELFAHMEHWMMRPTQTTFSHLLMTACKATPRIAPEGVFGASQSTLARLKMRGLAMDVVLCRTLIHVYGVHLKRSDLVRPLLAELRQQGLKPNRYLVSTYLTAHKLNPEALGGVEGLVSEWRALSAECHPNESVLANFVDALLRSVKVERHRCETAHLSASSRSSEWDALSAQVTSHQQASQQRTPHQDSQQQAAQQVSQSATAFTAEARTVLPSTEQALVQQYDTETLLRFLGEQCTQWAALGIAPRRPVLAHLFQALAYCPETSALLEHLWSAYVIAPIADSQQAGAAADATTVSSPPCADLSAFSSSQDTQFFLEKLHTWMKGKRLEPSLRMLWELASFCGCGCCGCCVCVYFALGVWAVCVQLYFLWWWW
jgi:Pentatricopeptide repeat domain